MEFAKVNISKVFCVISSVICITIVFSASDCYAYLDPSAGGWLYQLLFPVVVAISGAWVVLQRHIRELWRRFFSDNQVGRLTEKMRAFLARDNVQTLTMLPAIFAGVILPIEFLSEANGYLGYMRIWELFPVFGWQWLFFVFAGVIVSFSILLCTTLLAKLFHLSAPNLAGKALLWLSAVLFSLFLLRGTRLWFETSGFAFARLIPQAGWISVVVTAIVCAIWISTSSRTVHIVIRLAKFTASAGFVLTLIAPVVTWIESPAEGVLPVVNRAGEGSRHPDIILITVDALTATHMSLYGYSRPTTPNLETLAKEADVYERFYANSNITTTSVNSILHGVRPWTHRALQLSSMPLMSVAREGLVAKLKAAGYQTSAVATNRYAAPDINLSDKYFDQVSYGQINRLSARIGLIMTKYYHIHPLFKMLKIDESFDESINKFLVNTGVYKESGHFDPERALSALRGMIAQRKSDRPFFSWVHLYPPHSPYSTPEPFVGRFDPGSRHRTSDDSTPPWCYEARTDKTFPDEFVGRYDESIAYVDSHIGQFIDWLKAQGIYNDALIVVSADHGESFSHGYGAHAGPALHEDLIHVPLVIKEPGQRKGRRIPYLSEHIDLMPTIMEYAGFPAASTGEGKSIRPVQNIKLEARPVFSMNFQQNYCFGVLFTGTVAMIQGDWKYVLYFGDINYPMMPKLESSLYNLRTDPGENFNLIAVQPVIANEMLAAIEGQLRKHGGETE